MTPMFSQALEICITKFQLHDYCDSYFSLFIKVAISFGDAMILQEHEMSASLLQKSSNE